MWDEGKEGEDFFFFSLFSIMNVILFLALFQSDLKKSFNWFNSFLIISRDQTAFWM